MSGGFFNLGVKLPFGMSNANNPGSAPANGNPNFPANKQLDPKNPGADPNNTKQLNAGNNEPNNDPNNNADPTKNQNQGSPLDQFSDVFKIATGADGQPQIPVDPLASPITQFDPKKLADAAKQMNFAAGISQDQLAKAMSGQDPQAFLAVLNQVAQNGFTAALTVSTNTLETGIQKFRTNLDTALPERVRSVQISQAAPQNPVLNHPAAKPMVDAMKLQIARSNPELSPARVADMAENYFVTMMTEMSANTTQQQQSQQASSKKETNWMDLLDPNAVVNR